MDKNKINAKFTGINKARNDFNIEFRSKKRFSRIFVVFGIIMYVVAALYVIEHDFSVFFIEFIGIPRKYRIFLILASLLGFIGFSYFEYSATKVKKSIGLSNNEKLFLDVYKLHNNIDIYLTEQKTERKEKTMSDFLENIENIMNYMNLWEYGNIDFIKISIGEKVDSLKRDLKRIDLTEIKKGDEKTLEKLKIFLNSINAYLCESELDNFDKIYLSLLKLPMKKIEKEEIRYGFIDNVYEKHIHYTIIFSVMVISIFLIPIKYYNLGITEIIFGIPTISVGVFVVIEKILNEGKKNRKIKVFEAIEKEEEPIATMPSVSIEIPEDKENILFEENFEGYDLNYKPLTPWSIIYKNEGRVFVTDEIKGALSSKNCLKIDVPLNSNAYIRRTFEQQRKIKLEYYLRQGENRLGNNGSPFIVESHDIVTKGNQNNRAVYMEITNTYLKIGLPKPEIICEIEKGLWYKISLEIDCIKHNYTCKVNDKELIKGDVHQEFKSVYAIRTKHALNVEWVTYLDEIKVFKIE